MKFEPNKILSCGINWESQRHRLNLCIAISFLGTQKTHLLIPCDKLKSANNSDHIGRAHMIILIGFHETRPALPSSLFLHCQSTLSLAFTHHIFALIHSFLPLSAANSAQSVSIWLPSRFFFLSVWTDLIYNVLTTISAEHDMKESVSMKERGETGRVGVRSNNTMLY